MIRLVVAGGAGKMGREVCKAVDKDPDLALVGAVGRQSLGIDLGKTLHLKDGVVVVKDLDRCLKENRAQVMVDFTHPASVMDNVRLALKKGVHVVVGTTGISEKDLKEIEGLTQKNKANAVVAPNFALGAVLMIKFCELAAGYFPRVEIIEEHHDKKVDVPSGTAIKTAESIALQRKAKFSVPTEETAKEFRGGVVKGVRVHSIRLPGFNAHQEVIFGGPGQTLKIRHDVLDRSCYMPGVIMAIKKVLNQPGLTYGLDKLLNL